MEKKTNNFTGFFIGTTVLQSGTKSGIQKLGNFLPKAPLIFETDDA